MLAVQSVRARVSEQLHQVQVGFSVSGGAEAAAHATRKFISNAHPHDIMLKIDMRNAFNSLRRDHILEKNITTCPGICRLIHCAHSTPSALLIGDEIIASSSGVQQGDPLSPLLPSMISPTQSGLPLAYGTSTTLRLVVHPNPSLTPTNKS